LIADVTLLIFDFLSLPRRLFSSAFVCLFVSRIMQKLLDQFSQNSVEKAVEETYSLVVIQIT